MKEESTNTDWNLLAKYLAGEADKIEIREVNEWLKKTANLDTYLKIKSDWEIAGKAESQYNTDAAWNKLNRNISENSNLSVNINNNSNNNTSWYVLRMAASIIFILATGILLFLALSGTLNQDKVSTGEYDSYSYFLLPDGSEVYLNSGSTLKYPKKFR